MAKSKLNIIRKSRKLEFWYDKEFFIYEKRSEKDIIAEFIWNGEGEKIYGPLMGDQTEEGIKIYKALQRRLKKDEF